MLDADVRERLSKRLETLRADGKLHSPDELQGYFDSFRERFGPDRLASLDGEGLLRLMHQQGDHNSLVYWLEFKNDSEMASDIFGSIAGGSALKFGVYWDADIDQWRTGSPQANRTIGIDEAVGIAQRHRDELIAAVSVLRSAQEDISGPDLQTAIERAAPTIHNSAWAHKYLYMLFPDRLEDFHVESYQRFFLIKIRVSPPDKSGRYATAPVYMRLASELGAPINYLTSTLLEEYGRPHRYWKVGTFHGDNPKDSRWPGMVERGVAAVGWSAVGDLSQLQGSKEKLRERIAEYYNFGPQQLGRETQQLFNFVAAINPGDYVIGCSGGTALGIGRIIGDYHYDGSWDFPHTKRVEWLSIEEWRMPNPEGLRMTIREIRRPENLLEIERRLVHPIVSSPPRLVLHHDVIQRIRDVLERKGQVILYGPPGTGKTYWAERAARGLAADHAYGTAFDALTAEQREEVIGQDGLVQMCTFHPGYGYEDFLEGFCPAMENGAAGFQLTDGIFKRICATAQAKPHRNFYLIIDEINRGDVSRIFGELMTVLEKDKRKWPIVLPLSGARLRVPPNVAVIGTMNTADRSISLLDAALRRRFGFIELLPNTETLRGVNIEGLPLAAWLEGVNRRLLKSGGRDARNRQVGHSYFLEADAPVTEVHRFARILREDIIPLLEEYCYEDYGTLGSILGDLVDVQAQRLKDELFEPGRWPQLLDSLLRVDPDVSASRAAVAAEPVETTENEDEADEDGDK